MTPRDTLAATIVVVAWGVNFVAVKVGVTQLPPLLFSALRFAIVALAVVPFLKPPRDRLGLILLLALVLGVGHFGVLFIGMRGLDAATAAISLQLCVPFAAVVAALVYGERLGWLGIAGMAVAFLGVALLAGEPQRPDLASLGLVLFSAIAWAWSLVVIKRIGAIDPLLLNGWMALFAVPAFLLLSLAFETGQLDALRHADRLAWEAVAFSAVITSLIAHTLWYRLVARLPLNQVVPFTLLSPVIGVASGVVLLGEPLGWHKLLGGALTVLGVAIVQFRPRNRPTEVEDAAPPVAES